MFSDKPKYSANDLEHIAIWSNDPKLLARAADEAALIRSEGLDPNNFYFLWAIVGVPTTRWDKKDGPPPSGVSSLGDLVPVIAIDLAAKKPSHVQPAVA